MILDKIQNHAQHDFRQLDGEVARLEAEEAKYFLWILEAFKQIDLLADDKAVAAEAMNAVIAQWQDELIQRLDDMPPQIVTEDPIDPETGEPWTDQEKAQREALWTAMNAARTGTGQWRPIATQSPEAVFYNAAMEPGHLKWKPFCRHGTITALGGDLCSVTLMPVQARQEKGNYAELNLNTETALTNVPIQYMWCNGAAFEVGDEVLVLFECRDRLRPKVIGFKSNPRSCEGRISWSEF